MKKPKTTEKIKIRPTAKTQKTIYKIVITDYENQLKLLKRNKKNFISYELYRYNYVRLHNAICDTKRALKKIIENEKEN